MKMKKIVKITCISLVSIISLFIVIILVIACLGKVMYQDFYNNSEEMLAIRGLEEDYIPQGLAYSEKEDVFLTSGYILNEKEASRIYVIASDDSSSKYVSLLNEDETPFLGHCGGIGAYEDLVFIACDDDSYNKVFIFSLSEIINSENGNSVKVHSSKELDINPAYVSVYNQTLFIGEFHKNGSKYLTDESHHLETTSGEINVSLCYAFSLDKIINQDEWEIEYVLSLRDKVQGLACLSEGRFAISTSWSIFSSNLYIYNDVFANKGEFNGYQLYYLDENSLQKKIALPPMSEEIQVYQNKLLINFESNGKKYRAVNIFRQDYIWSYQYEE